MGAGLENVFENDEMRSHRPVGSHVSIEINAFCPFSGPKACGDRCVLQARKAPKELLLRPDEIGEMFQEILDCGNSIRHFGVPGMEPLASPNILFDLLDRYHNRRPDERPLTFNVITSGYGLSEAIPRFRELPIGALIISVDDTPFTGLRTDGAGDAALKNGLLLREQGGCAHLCVNTVLNDRNASSVLTISRQVHALGVDQMLVSPQVSPYGSLLKPTLSQEEIIAFAHMAAADQKLQGLNLFVCVESGAFVDSDLEMPLIDPLEWSARVPLGDSSVSLLVLNYEAPFVRVRWDGQMLLRNELMTIGLQQSKVGRYQPGSMSKLIEAWATECIETA